MTSDNDILQNEIARRTAQGWEIVSRGTNEVQMRRPKRFSFGWAIFWFLFFGVGVLVYLIWHWLKSEQLAFIRVSEGRLVVSEHRGLLGTLLLPFGAYWRWAGSRETTQAKALAYGGPAAAVLVLVIIIAVATGGGDEDEGGPAAQTQLSPTVAAEESLTAEPPTDGEVQETPEPTPEPEEPSVERIVAAAPGAVAEAEDMSITLNEIADPWVSSSDFAPDEPGPGKRFVAFDVTMHRTKESGTHFACWTEFSLTDTEGFLYEYEILFDLEPPLDCVNLGGDQKTRGWIGFEVDEGTPLDVLKYDPNILTTNDIEFQFR